MKDGIGHFTRACIDRIKGNGLKLEEGRYRLDTEKTFYTVKVLKQCNRLPREVVGAVNPSTPHHINSPKYKPLPNRCIRY